MEVNTRRIKSRDGIYTRQENISSDDPSPSPNNDNQETEHE